MQQGLLEDIGATTGILSYLLGVEVWHALAADEAGKHILVAVNHGIEALARQHLNHLVDLLKISLIPLCFNVILGATFGFNLDGFPRDAESYEVYSP